MSATRPPPDECRRGNQDEADSYPRRHRDERPRLRRVRRVGIAVRALPIDVALHAEQNGQSQRDHHGD
jgi:hypothetical protein